MRNKHRRKLKFVIMSMNIFRNNWMRKISKFYILLFISKQNDNQIVI